MSEEKNRFPPSWDAERVQRIIDHYESQTEDEAVAEDEAAFELEGHTVMVVPHHLVPAVLALIEEVPAPAAVPTPAPEPVSVSS